MDFEQRLIRRRIAAFELAARRPDECWFTRPDSRSAACLEAWRIPGGHWLLRYTFDDRRIFSRTEDLGDLSDLLHQLTAALKRDIAALAATEARP